MVISLPCRVARCCHAVFRKLSAGRSRRAKPLTVALLRDAEGLHLRCAVDGVLADYCFPAPGPDFHVVVPLEALADIEGRSGEATFTPRDGMGLQLRLAKDRRRSGEATFTPRDGGVAVQWTKAGQPQSRFDRGADQQAPTLPAWPATSVENPPALLAALERAGQVAAKESVRFALERLQLRGGTGEVAATDGRQLLVEGGYRFPWPEDLLVHRSGVFGCPELSDPGPVQVARGENQVLIRTGNWTVALQVAEKARFPNVDSVLPSPRQAATVWRLGANEPQALIRSLRALPGSSEDLAPVTVDLGHSVRLRARQGKGHAVEVTLPDSTVQGRPLRFATNRQYLARACAFGFRTFAVADHQPVVCREGQRVFLWMVLDPGEALPPQPFSVHVPLAGEGRGPAGSSAAPDRAVARIPSAPASERSRARGARKECVPSLAVLLPLWAAQLRNLAGLVGQALSSDIYFSLSATIRIPDHRRALGQANDNYFSRSGRRSGLSG